LLWKENTDLRSLALEMRNELAKKEQLIAEKEQLITDISQKVFDLDKQANTANNQLNEIYSSRSWQFLQKIQRFRLRLFPRGSWGERLLLRKGK